MTKAKAKQKKNPVAFLRSVSRELKRVTWPTKKELTRYTWVVLITLAFMVGFFYVVDLVIATLLRAL